MTRWWGESRCRGILLLLLLLFPGVAAARTLIDIRGGYVLYSKDYNHLLATGGVTVRGDGFTLTCPRLDLDLDLRKGRVTGGGKLQSGSTVEDFDLGEIDLGAMSMRVFRFGAGIVSKTIPLGAPSAAGSSWVEGFTARSLGELEKSLLYFVGTRMVVHGGFGVTGHHVVVFIEGIPTVGFKKWRLDGGGEDDQPPMFTLTRSWYSSSMGAVLGGRISAGRNSFTTVHDLTVQYDLFRSLDWPRRDRIGYSSSTKLKLGSWGAVTGQVNYASQNILALSLGGEATLGKVAASSLSLELSQGYRGVQEVWGRSKSRLSLGSWGRIGLSLNAGRERQSLVEVTAGAMFARRFQFSLRHQQSRLRSQNDQVGAIGQASLALSYSAGLFDVATDYSFTTDRLRDQWQSSPGFRVTARPFSFYHDLLSVGFQVHATRSWIGRGGVRDLLGQVVAGFSVATQRLQLTPETAVQVSLASEWNMDRDPLARIASTGIILRGWQGLPGPFALELLYNYHARRALRDWWITGTTSQDFTCLVRTRRKLAGFSGWTSLSVDSKRGELTVAYFDGALDLFKNWQAHTQINYDFLARRWIGNFYLIRRAGRFQLRISYRTLGGFLVEFTPR